MDEDEVDDESRVRIGFPDDCNTINNEFLQGDHVSKLACVLNTLWLFDSQRFAPTPRALTGRRASRPRHIGSVATQPTILYEMC